MPDCCYSGRWVTDCAKTLDGLGIPPCGHRARESGILIKVYASCQADQKATEPCYSVEANEVADDGTVRSHTRKYASETQSFCGTDSRHSFLVNRTPYGLPVPTFLHQTITEEELGGRRLMIVGDVHGCYDELSELLDQTNGRDPGMCVVFVGDLVNKGPKSAEVVKLVRSMCAYSVRGNHDEVSLRAWQDFEEGRNTLSQEFQWMQTLSREDLDWLYELPYTISIPSANMVVVHAGLLPQVPLTEQSFEHLIHLRNVSYDPVLSTWVGHRKILEGSIPWVSVWKGPQCVYFGHDAIRHLQLLPLAKGLDTGCVYGGKLTAIFPEEGDKIVQVEAHTTHKVPGKRHAEKRSQVKQKKRSEVADARQ